MSAVANETLRADARRNLTLILRAAREVFAESGLGVGVAEVARQAGVGNATIFRRFPQKEDLIVAVVESMMRERIDEERSRPAAESAGQGLAGAFVSSEPLAAKEEIHGKPSSGARQ